MQGLTESGNARSCMLWRWCDLEDKLLERLVALRSQDWDEGIFNCIYEHMNYLCYYYVQLW